MSYTPPAGDAADFSWVGVTTYAPPAGDEANFSWAVTEITGTGEGTLALTGSAEGEHTNPSVDGTGTATLPFAGTAVGVHAVGGPASGAFPFSAEAVGKHGAAGPAAGIFGLAGAAVAVHPRYELRGVVKVGGALVDRRVRAYNRDSGELVGQVDTVAGAFVIRVGFAEDEFYVTPIDLDDAAVDWKPPTANRVLSVLVEDTA